MTVSDLPRTVVDDGVAVWCFAGPAMRALSDDEAGHGLPAGLGPWTLRKSLTIDGASPDEAEALRLIRKHGFCCFDPMPETEA